MPVRSTNGPAIIGRPPDFPKTPHAGGLGLRIADLRAEANPNPRSAIVNRKAWRRPMVVYVAVASLGRRNCG